MTKVSFKGNSSIFRHKEYKNISGQTLGSDYSF